MARDRFDDDYADDDRRDRDRDDRRDDRDRGERGRDDYDDRPRRSDARSVDRVAVRGKVGLPGVLLILSGLASLLLGGTLTAVSVANPAFFPEKMFDFFIPFIEKQPPSPQRDAQLKQMREQRAEVVAKAQQGVDPVNLGLNLLFLVPSVLMVVGGLKMRSLSGWGLALTGAIIALIPGSNYLCCLAMPIGLWALIVLVNSDVKAAFRRPAADPLDRQG